MLEKEATRPREIGKLSPEVPRKWLSELKKMKDEYFEQVKPVFKELDIRN